MTSGETPTDNDEEPNITPSDAFGALSNSLRIDILQALGEYHRETRGRNPIGFADFRRRVGVDDSGRFRYHVNQLCGNFIEKGDGGYRLTYAGAKIIAAMLMGTYTTRVTKDAEELDTNCFVCDNPAIATYEDGLCEVSCANDHPLFAWQVPPTAAADTTLPEIVEIAELLARQGMEQALIGICSECYHSIETEILVEETARPIFHTECEACGAQLISPIGYCLLADPRVAALYRRHGEDLHEYHMWELPFVQDETMLTITEDSPVRAELDICLRGETLRVTLNETGHITDHRLIRK